MLNPPKLSENVTSMKDTAHSSVHLSGPRTKSPSRHRIHGLMLPMVFPSLWSLLLGYHHYTSQTVPFLSHSFFQDHLARWLLWQTSASDLHVALPNLSWEAIFFRYGVSFFPPSKLAGCYFKLCFLPYCLQSLMVIDAVFLLLLATVDEIAYNSDKIPYCWRRVNNFASSFRLKLRP